MPEYIEREALLEEIRMARNQLLINKTAAAKVEKIVKAAPAAHVEGSAEDVRELNDIWGKAHVEIGIPFDRLRELVQAEKAGRLVTLPFVAMVEQSLQDGKMTPQRDQCFNGRYAVVYSDRRKWKSPLIDICGKKKYDREEAEARMAELTRPYVKAAEVATEVPPPCFYGDENGVCPGISLNNDDEPIERCKQCWYCSAGYRQLEPDAATKET